MVTLVAALDRLGGRRGPSETQSGDFAGPELGLDLAVQIGFLAVAAGPDRPGHPSARDLLVRQVQLEAGGQLVLHELAHLP